MRKRNPQDELVKALSDISRAHFHSPVRKKVAISMQGDPSCPSGMALRNRALCVNSTPHTSLFSRVCAYLSCYVTRHRLKFLCASFHPVRLRD